MSVTITVQGITVKAKVILKSQLLAAWKRICSEPFPRVGAFQLLDSDFDRVMRFTQKSSEDEWRERLEWGRVLPIEGTDASVCTANEFAGVDGVDFVILVRENPYHKLSEILEHELGHIARGDL